MDSIILHNQEDLNLIDKFLILMEYSELNDKYIDQLKNDLDLLKLLFRTMVINFKKLPWYYHSWNIASFNPVLTETLPN